MDTMLELNQVLQGLSSATNIIFSKYPNNTVQGTNALQYSGWGVKVTQLVYISGSVNVSTLGLPRNPEWDSCTNCISKNSLGEQLWGSFSAELDVSDTLFGTQPAFSSLKRMYDYILWQHGDNSSVFTANKSRINIYASGPASLSDPVTVAFDVVPGNTWYLDVQLKGFA
ncbi:hypothetical protein CEUSTIGMA_g6572.t1 [Chlamydomonas eustigma]|uniref:Uncharacterized protein n=1 Tax=Chlamydomonas eustigma TaxID=1157962 RepID=A0A250X8B5_9CHLO|nr:hypothetical protein CEUSTIGMA_g6572.t1 [Chlamydomonas eustigma]|eukprot:GAX79132.1 hypothetical protein CEUSTIGMA_g6572.t1 [Chlamydomonas eustigma]